MHSNYFDALIMPWRHLNYAMAHLNDAMAHLNDAMVQLSSGLHLEDTRGRHCLDVS